LQPPMTPIVPVFVRPSKSPAPRDIKFASEPIMRGNSEDMLIPKRGERGDDFWRRFSMVAHVEKTQQHKERYDHSILEHPCRLTDLSILSALG
jgi:hypothetical protein